jgi:hypothetical protein
MLSTHTGITEHQRSPVRWEQMDLIAAANDWWFRSVKAISSLSRIGWVAASASVYFIDLRN